MKKVRNSKMQIQTINRACHAFMLGKLRTTQDVGRVNIITVKQEIGEVRNGLVIAE